MTEFGIGLLAVLLASVVLLLAVLRELAPAGGLTGRGRWLLVAGLGSGVFAFATKLALIGSLELAAADTLRPAAGEMPALPEHRLPTDRGEQRVPVLSPAYVWQALPYEAPVPAGNPMSAAKVALGKELFFERALSRDRTLACATCHDLVGGGGADGRRTSLGIDGKQGARNAPTVWNAAFQPRLFWDGRAGSLEEQATGPMVNAVEMGMPSLAAVVDRLAQEPRYRSAFRSAFDDDAPISIERIAAAIAAYERTLITPDSAYDRFVRGDTGALDAQALRGMALFAAVGCVNCHSGPNFSGSDAMDTAPYRIFPATDVLLERRLHLLDDLGRAGAGSGRGVWRIPSLRNVALTAPYFHNGAVDRLDDAVRIMAQAQLGLRLERDGTDEPRVLWSTSAHTTHLAAPLSLSEREVQDITAFLRSLSGDALLAARTARMAAAAASTQP